VTAPLTLKPLEQDALRWLGHVRSLLVTRVPDRTETDVLGFRTPGQAVFQRLEKWGLCLRTEEDPIDPSAGPDSETWTPTFDLTEAGEAWLTATGLA
jgi:hypothetical protein